MSMQQVSRRSFLQLLAAAGALPASPTAWTGADLSLNERMSGNFSPVHDPCIIKADGAYHVFCTGHTGTGPGLIPWRVSRDLLHWELKTSVFSSMPGWTAEAVPGSRGLWAPDISYFNGRYHLYYACSTFGSNRSAIGLATRRTLDAALPRHEWVDHGPVFESDRDDDFNAIDPNHIEDRDGRHWLLFGSFWGGIKMIPVDAATGKPPPGNLKIRSLASRPVPEGAPDAVEAPYMIERSGWYYLFVSYDYCCRGVDSSYYIVVGRSKKPTGPFVGRDGRSMTEGYGTLLLHGNRDFRGPGHSAWLRDGKKEYLVYHAYDAHKDGRPTLRISPVTWTADGWPTVSL